MKNILTNISKFIEKNGVLKILITFVICIASIRLLDYNENLVFKIIAWLSGGYLLLTIIYLLILRDKTTLN